jgi:DNA polymerase IV
MSCQVWSRAIILVDMNAFFASVEQQDHPEWQGRPVAVTNGARGSTIITSSYEARAWGVKTGMRLKEARQSCPELIQAPSRPHRYAAISSQIMQALTTITPDVEVFSVDEAFLDVTGCQKLLGQPEHIARQVKKVVFDASGVLSSVGLSGDKTTAKYAAKQHKPDGFTVIYPWEAEAVLANVPVTELCGINKGIGRYLAERQVFVCGDMKSIPVSELLRRFGRPGRRIWLMAQGQDPEPVNTIVAAPKSIGHGKVIPPNTQDINVVLTYFQHMSEKVAARLRRHRLNAQQFYIAFNTQKGWIKTKARSVNLTDDGAVIFALCRDFLGKSVVFGVYQVQVTALDPVLHYQTDLFDAPDEKTRLKNAVMDAINLRYGEFKLSPARLLNRSDMPNVIAPGWRPNGHRRTV